MTLAAVVLAAGKGTRFRSQRAKVLHPVAGRTMLRWVLEAVRPLGLDRVVVVVGHQAAEVQAEAEAAELPGLSVVLQPSQLGTGHAVRTAFDAPQLAGVDTVVVLPGDAPLLTPGVLGSLLDAHLASSSRLASTASPAATLLTTRLVDPTGYGRVLRDTSGGVTAVVEEGDATVEQRLVTEVNTSIYAFAAAPLVGALKQLRTDNVQGEEYLTDVVAPLTPQGIGALLAPAEDVAGVNDRVQLAAAGAVLRQRIAAALALEGVTIVDPATTYVEAGVRVGADATLLPGTHLEGDTVVGEGATIGPDTRLVDASVDQGATVTYSVVLGATVGPRATVGPFSYLRPGTRLDVAAKAGAFVEMKNAQVGEHAKVPHLSYMGDVTIGRDANVGAGTITCNYDGYDKHRTEIGDGAFIGSDTMLVAPVRIGDGAVTGAASAITQDVPAEALALERSEQRTFDGWARHRRDRQQRGSGG